MDVDISKWEKIAHGPDGDSTGEANKFPGENAAASVFILSELPSFLIINQPSPKQPSVRLFAALNTEVK